MNNQNVKRNKRNKSKAIKTKELKAKGQNKIAHCPLR